MRKSQHGTPNWGIFDRIEWQVVVGSTSITKRFVGKGRFSVEIQNEYRDMTKSEEKKLMSTPPCTFEVVPSALSGYPWKTLVSTLDDLRRSNRKFGERTRLGPAALSCNVRVKKKTTLRSTHSFIRRMTSTSFVDFGNSTNELYHLCLDAIFLPETPHTHGAPRHNFAPPSNLTTVKNILWKKKTHNFAYFQRSPWFMS